MILRRRGAAAPPPQAEEAVACRAEALNKVYGRRDTQVRALRDVDLELPARAFTAIMGPSGSGKSTLLHCLAALDTPSSGRVYLGSTELTALNRRQQAQIRRDRIGFVFQAFNLVPTLDALENITLPQMLAGRRPDKAWLDHVIDRIGLGDRLHHRPSELSGGQQQRIALARALAGRPAVIFADEPTGNLDTTASADMLTLLRDAVDQFAQTVVTVTHDPTIADYADQILRFADGRVVDRVGPQHMDPARPHHARTNGGDANDDLPPVDDRTAPVDALRTDGHDTMRSRRKRDQNGTTPGRPMVGSDDEVEVARQERWLRRIREQFETEHGGADLQHNGQPAATHHAPSATSENGRYDREVHGTGVERVEGVEPVERADLHDTAPHHPETTPYTSAEPAEVAARGAEPSSLADAHDETAPRRSQANGVDWLPPERSWRRESLETGRDSRRGAPWSRPAGAHDDDNDAPSRWAPVESERLTAHHDAEAPRRWERDQDQTDEPMRHDPSSRAADAFAHDESRAHAPRRLDPEDGWDRRTNGDRGRTSTARDANPLAYAPPTDTGRWHLADEHSRTAPAGGDGDGDGDRPTPSASDHGDAWSDVWDTAGADEIWTPSSSREHADELVYQPEPGTRSHVSAAPRTADAPTDTPSTPETGRNRVGHDDAAAAANGHAKPREAPMPADERDVDGSAARGADERRETRSTASDADERRETRSTASEVPPALASLRNTRRPDETGDPLYALQSLQDQLNRLTGPSAGRGRGGSGGAAQ